MSSEAKQVWEARSQAPRGSVYDVGRELAWRAQPNTNLAWPSNRDLARALRLSERQVQRALRWLEDAGEIIPQPASRGRRRVFLITPGAPHQEPLFIAEGRHSYVAPKGDIHVALEGDEGRHSYVALEGDEGRHSYVALEGDMGVHEGDTHAGARKEHKKTNNKTTPPTPRPGGSSPDLLGSLHRTALIAGRPASPPRRRRHRDAFDAALLEDCPNGSTDEQAIAAWEQIAPLLRERLGDSTWQVWLAGAHAHRLHAGALVLGLPPNTLLWVCERFGRVIAEASPLPVALVGCQTSGAQR